MSLINVHVLISKVIIRIAKTKTTEPSKINKLESIVGGRPVISRHDSSANNSVPNFALINLSGMVMAFIMWPYIEVTIGHVIVRRCTHKFRNYLD